MYYPAVGAFLHEHSCSFTVWAPFRKKVEVILEDLSSRRMLERDADGYWTCSVDEISAGARFLYRLDGDAKFPDPASRAQPDGVHGPSEVVEEAYPWQDTGWQGLSTAAMVIYELHVGTFTDRRKFEGVISKLPYLQALGVNAIELMPVAQFPGARNWGYDGVFPFAVQNSYGGPRGLKDLVNQAHLHGIAIILDVVYNHQGPEGNYLAEYGPYFTDKYKTGWGQAINFDDAWCDGVRHFYWQNALMWLDEFHVDSLRLDAVHAIRDFSARHFIEELSLRVKALEEKTGRRKTLIAEFDLNNPRYVSPLSRGGYGLDAQWADEFHHALHVLITGETDGYYEDFGSTDHLAHAMKNSYVYTGQYSVHRKKHFGREPLGTTYDQFVVFAQNHDQVGNRLLGDRLSMVVSREALKLAAATVLLSPHVPLLFMGEEYGEKHPFQYFVSHTDKHLVEQVRKGRKEEFAYFNWEGPVPDPQAEATFEACTLSWPVDVDSKVLSDFYRHLITFRKTRPAMQGRTRDSLKMLSWENGVVLFERRHADDYLLIALNFNKATASLPLPGDKQFRKIFDSASSKWGGPALETVEESQGIKIASLSGESAQVYEN
ncbi:MAG TPA: malto-oligosyltrehalose trehalohydrolase [Chryseosolibacter sp.]|nr:malto-oligosyltrehalose trehalohydrolase [Chryseosolibacter sp.]